MALPPPEPGLCGLLLLLALRVSLARKDCNDAFADALSLAPLFAAGFFSVDDGEVVRVVRVVRVALLRTPGDWLRFTSLVLW